MANTIRVKAVIADGNVVVFYKEDGTTVNVPSDDPALPELLKTISPRLVRNEVVEISLDDYSVYDTLSKKTNGFVRFFRAAKNAVAAVFNPTLVEPPVIVTETEVSLSPEEIAPEPVKEPQPKPFKVEEEETPPEPEKRTYDALKDDLKPESGNADVPEDETVVAVIGNVVIPGMEKLRPYITHALKTNSEKAVKNFLERIARIIDKRGHSVEDLMRFMEKGDLPLAEDGSIIAYKILRKRNDGVFTYVDCHSGNVHQRVGSVVFVEESLVDKNRRNECSNGLHVARRGYLGHFSGDVCVMIKMAPEDVVTVPHNDPNKVRVMAYHIIFELTNEVFNVLRSNKPMTSNPKAAAMLAAAIKGDHIGVLERVQIGGSKGSNLSVHDQVQKEDAHAEQRKARISNVKAETAEKAVAMDDPKASQVIDTKALNEQVKKEKAKVVKEQTKKAAKPEPKKKSKPIPPKVQKAMDEHPKTKAAKAINAKLTKSEIARDLYNNWINANGVRAVEALQKLKDFQRAAKKGWAVLGFTQEEIDLIKSS